MDSSPEALTKKGMDWIYFHLAGDVNIKHSLIRHWAWHGCGRGRSACSLKVVCFVCLRKTFHEVHKMWLTHNMYKFGCIHVIFCVGLAVSADETVDSAKGNSVVVMYLYYSKLLLST